MNLFKTGDRVVATVDHHQGFFGLGDTGTVRSEDPRFVDSYFVKFDHQDILSNPISVSENQLQLIKAGMTGSGIKLLGFPTPSNSTFKPGDLALFTKYNAGLLNYGELVEIISHDEPKKHKCDWKTYTGLMYKEEYCDCGQTKNRRGIFE